MWERIPGSLDGLWPCCMMIDRNSVADRDLMYRVTTIDSAPPNRRSEPVLSNSIVNWTIRTAAPRLNAEGFLVGGSGQLANPGLRNVAWVSMDTFVVALHSPGVVRAKQLGQTYVIATGLNNDGAVQSSIYRITVQPAR